MISIKLTPISLLMTQVMGASLQERLLDSAINSTKCEARCGGLEDAEDAQECLEVCEMVTRIPRTASVCGVTSLCTGACQAGCGEAVEAEDIQLTSLEEGGCGLNWEMETENGKVVFLVSGASGVEDIKTVNIEKIEAGCEVRDVDTTTKSPENTRAREMKSNTDVDIQMVMPQLPEEILICSLVGVIFLISILVITFISIRGRFRPNKNSGVSFTKLDALPL